MALGHCSQEHYPVLFEELPGLMEEYTRSKQRRGTAARPEEVMRPYSTACLTLHPQIMLAVRAAMRVLFGADSADGDRIACQ